MSLRSKRLGSGLDAGLAAFLDSTREDAALLRDDILGSLAHVAGLRKAGLLTADEAARLHAALVDLYQQADAFDLDPAHEDVHMNVEAWLTARLGDLGRKLHTARSRNDQVALDLRLWTRRQLLGLAAEVERLARALLGHAARHPAAVMPGHTHFQIGQPVLLAHHLGAHVARLDRDLARITESYARVDVSPLGAGALAGTGHPVDPGLTAHLLGFRDAFTNSLDAVSDRDFAQEALFGAALVLNHVSGLAEELILFTHPAFAFATLDDAHATGSSLMPQKKNPDVLEVARAKAATAAGALAASLAHTRALPLAYNRDLQENKRLLLETLPSATATVGAVATVLEGLTWHPDAMRRLAGAGYSDATDLADYLVRKGVPFRDAHGQAAQVVQRALARGVELKDLPLGEFQAVNPALGPDVFDVLGPDAAVAARTSPGGTGPVAARESLQVLERSIEAHRTFVHAMRESLDRARERLLQADPVVNRP